MDWFFDGLGTFLIGLVVGGGAGGAVAWKVAVNRSTQSQRAGNHASQTQVGRDQVGGNAGE